MKKRILIVAIAAKIVLDCMPDFLVLLAVLAALFVVLRTIRTWKRERKY